MDLSCTHLGRPDYRNIRVGILTLTVNRRLLTARSGHKRGPVGGANRTIPDYSSGHSELSLTGGALPGRHGLTKHANARPDK